MIIIDIAQLVNTVTTNMTNLNVLSDSPLVFYVDNFLSKDQCENLIEETESNYIEAPITIDGNAGIFEMNKDIKNNTRAIVDDKTLAYYLFTLVNKYLPKEFKDWRLFSLNDRFRFYKYEKGQTFKPHIDGSYKPYPTRLESKLTLLIYLSDVKEGGETSFFDGTEDKLRFKLKPKVGQLVVFDHHQLHSGDPVLEGVKYVLRTDVMYQNKY